MKLVSSAKASYPSIAAPKKYFKDEQSQFETSKYKSDEIVTRTKWKTICHIKPK